MHTRKLISPMTLVLVTLCAPTHAAPLNLAQSPAALGSEPAPNIIVSVDDSGSMGSSGIRALQSALRETFSQTNVPDNRIRLAWQSMRGCRGIPSQSTDCRGDNHMARLTSTHRTNFMNWVGTLSDSGGTPSHLMMDEAGRYLSRTDLGDRSPWASNPGVREAPVLSCRKSFHIFMTDGGWNSVATSTLNHLDTSGDGRTRIVRGGNADNTQITLPDGVVYDPTSAQTRLYRDNWGSNGLSTLSDLAFYYWSRDLQPDLPNNVRPSPRELYPRQNFGTASNPAELDPYWNPRNNPATWQHMVNYTIGFNNAAQWSGNPPWGGDTFTNLSGLINNSYSWPSPFCNNNSACDGPFLYSARENERKVELWHAALNSRGRFVPANSAASLVSAFQIILDDILPQTSQALVSIAGSASRLRSNGLVYIAGYDSNTWSGSLNAYPINAETLAISATPSWSAHALLDNSTPDISARNILTHNGSQGAAFVWGQLSEAQQLTLRGTSSEEEGQRTLSYLRGDRTAEIGQTNGTLRRRESRLGDVSNSNIWQTSRPTLIIGRHEGHATFRATHAGRTPVVYVGANDGMLHAFHATNGRELMAYVPRGVYDHLRSYTQPNYSHRYFVDGHPFTGDADLSGRSRTTTNVPPPDWRTVLVSGLGGGGRGYFVLDVTRPVASADAASSYSPTGVLVDRTFSAAEAAPQAPEADIGHIYAEPAVSDEDASRSNQIVKLNNGRWAVVMGNGVNSVNERPVLLVQYLDGNRELFTIVAHSASNQSNGLSAPRLIDVNGDGTVDIAYAGDLLGNLWKFNLVSTDASQWGVAGWNGAATTCRNATTCLPLFVARDAASPANRQPITTAPLWMTHPSGGRQILFATGRHLEEADRSDTRVQTIYSVWDRSIYTFDRNRAISTVQERLPITTGRAALVRQTVTGNVTSRATGTELPTNYFNTSSNTVAYSTTNSSAPRGWYMDLPEARERVLRHPKIFEGQKVLVTSRDLPQGSADETCSPNGSRGNGWITVLNMITGQPSQTPVFETSDTTLNMDYASRARVDPDEFAAFEQKDGKFILVQPPAPSNPPGPAPDPINPPTNPADPGYANGPGSNASGTNPPQGPCLAGMLCNPRNSLLRHRDPGRRADWLELQ